MTESANILKGYQDQDGRFNRLPGKKQKKKLDAMILFFASKFDLDQKYTEMEVNEVLNQHHSFNDPATLRRLLIGTSKMQRTKDGTQYWRNHLV